MILTLVKERAEVFKNSLIQVLQALVQEDILYVLQATSIADLQSPLSLIQMSHLGSHIHGQPG